MGRASRRCPVPSPLPCRSNARPRRRARRARLWSRRHSPPSNPVIRRAGGKRPQISARWEIDLSPGTRTPERRADERAVRGCFIASQAGISGVSIAFDSTDAAWQWGAHSEAHHRGRSMSKPARGTKRVCPSCGARFYDLNRTPIVRSARPPTSSPTAPSRRSRNARNRRRRERWKKPPRPAAETPEVISLEEVERPAPKRQLPKTRRWSIRRRRAGDSAGRRRKRLPRGRGRGRDRRERHRRRRQGRGRLIVRFQMSGARDQF